MGALLRNILWSDLTEQRGLRANKNPKSSAASLPHTHRHNLMSFTLLNACGWQYWMCLFLQAMGLPLYIFPTGFPTPSFFALTTSSFAWDLFTQTLSGPISPYLTDSCTTYYLHCIPYTTYYLHACIWLPTLLWKPSTGLSVVFGILWLRFIPRPARCPGILDFHIP